MLDAAHNVGKSYRSRRRGRPGIDDSFPKYSNAHQTGWLRSAREGSHWLARGSPFFSRAAAVGSIFLFAMLVSVPCVVLFLTVNPLPDSPHLKLLQIPAVYGAVWALVSLWVALDSAKLFQHPRAASGPSRVVWHLGIAIGSAERRSFPARSYLAHLALTNIIRASLCPHSRTLAYQAAPDIRAVAHC